MHIIGVGIANPAARYTKADCLAAFDCSDWFGRLDNRAHYIARTVLQRDNGIEARRLAVDSLAEVFTIDPNTLARRFLRHAPLLAAQAGARALAAAEVTPAQIDAVVVSTCTGYLCPGLSGHVIERLALRGDVQAFDLVGQGCGAALPNLQLGQALLASGRFEHVLSVCVEVSSAAMYLDNDAGVLISACLFGDGAGAAALSGQAGVTGRRIEWIDSTSLTDPGQRGALMFEQRDGLNPGDVAVWLMHAGGRDVLLALEDRLELAPADLRYSAAMLREYGNLSSAFVYFVLQAALADQAAGGWWWLSSFGAGFSCHGALLAVH